MAIAPPNARPQQPYTAPQQTAGPAQEAQDNRPAPASLVEKLRDPKTREKMEKVLGGELLEKLDRIFNPTSPDQMPIHAVRQMMEQRQQQMKQMQEAAAGRQPGAQQVGAPQAGAQQPGAPQAGAQQQPRAAAPQRQPQPQQAGAPRPVR